MRLSTTFAIALSISIPAASNAAILCVNPGGTGGCFATVQAAVDAAGFGDTIEVAAGTYTENVELPDTRRRIHGAGVGASILQGKITVPFRGRLELSGMSIEGIGTDIGVLADAESQVQIASCAISGHGVGIQGFEPIRLTITDSTIADNGGTGVFVIGDFQDTPPKVAIARSTIMGSMRGIVIDSGGVQLKVDDSTVTGHSLAGVEAFSLDGPGRPRIAIRGSTIAGNGRGLVDSTPSDADLRVTLQSTIIADSSSGPDVAGGEMRLTSKGFNLLESIDPAVTVRGRTSLDLVGVDPLLGPLQDNGGPTETREPGAGSPALEAIPSRGACRRPDQRGVSRLPTPCDIGAVEAP